MKAERRSARSTKFGFSSWAFRLSSATESLPLERIADPDRKGGRRPPLALKLAVDRRRESERGPVARDAQPPREALLKEGARQRQVDHLPAVGDDRPRGERLADQH